MGLPQQVSSKYAGKRLLIVDDDADMRLLLAEYFRRLGFHVEEKESGAAALEPAPFGWGSALRRIAKGSRKQSTRRRDGAAKQGASRLAFCPVLFYIVDILHDI